MLSISCPVIPSSFMVALVVPLPSALCPDTLRVFVLLVVGIGGTGSRGLDELGDPFNGGRPRMCVGLGLVSLSRFSSLSVLA